jgi:predicted ArsR family transcriptional regulator
LHRVERDVIDLLKKQGSMSASEIAAILKLSEKAALSVIYGMARFGTVKITEVQATA